MKWTTSLPSHAHAFWHALWLRPVSGLGDKGNQGSYSYDLGLRLLLLAALAMPATIFEKAAILTVSNLVPLPLSFSPVVAPKATKKATSDNINSKLALVMKSGKVTLGLKVSRQRRTSSVGQGMHLIKYLDTSPCYPILPVCSQEHANWQGKAGPHLCQHPPSAQV